LAHDLQRQRRLALATEQCGLVLRELRDANTLMVANGHAIRRLVEFRIQYECAARQVAEKGTILKTKRSRVPQYNSHWIVMRQADDSIRVADIELGIFPLRRGKAGKVQRAKKAPRAADNFLKQSLFIDLDGQRDVDDAVSIAHAQALRLTGRA
jgi:hypothetical protein